MQCPCSNVIKSNGKSREREENERSEEEGGRHRKESNKEGRIAKTRRIDKTKGNALPDFPNRRRHERGSQTANVGENGRRWALLGERRRLPPSRSIRQAR